MCGVVGVYKFQLTAAVPVILYAQPLGEERQTSPIEVHTQHSYTQ